MELQPAQIRQSGPLSAIVRNAVRHAASVAPFGAVAGAALGLAGDGTEAMTSADAALLLAAVIGFGFAPMLASIVSIARSVRRPETELAHPLVSGVLLSIAFSVAWAVLAVLVSLAAASLVALDLDATRLLISALVFGVVGGAVLGLIAGALVRVARSGNASRAS